MVTNYSFILGQLRISDERLAERVGTVISSYIPEEPIERYSIKCYCSDDRHPPTLIVANYEHKIHIDRIIDGTVVETRITLNYDINSGSVDLCYRVYDHCAFLIIHRSMSDVVLYLFLDEVIRIASNTHNYLHKFNYENIKIEYNCIINNIETVNV